MGNTIATPSDYSDRRPSHISATRSLRKIASSSTLSSLRLYRRSNRSETSLSSKFSNLSRFGDKILDISKPTQVEHGIHVEYNNGKYMVKKKSNYRKIQSTN
jgi:hypothetical protein